MVSASADIDDAMRARVLTNKWTTVSGSVARRASMTIEIRDNYDSDRIDAEQQFAFESMECARIAP